MGHSGERRGRAEAEGEPRIVPALLGTFERIGTGTVHVLLTDHRTMCGLPAGDLGLRGSADWALKPEETPISCSRCRHLTLHGDRVA